MGISLIGNAGTVAEVEAAHKALRATLRPIDVGALGSYAITVKSGVMAAGLAGDSPVLAFRWAPTTTGALALIRRIKFSAWNLGTGFTAGNFVFNFFMARAFSAQDTGGGAVTLTTNNAKLRTAYATTQAAIQASTTATLSAGTRTKDANSFRTLAGVIANAAFSAMLPEQTEVFRQQPGEQPIVLATSEGFVIEATVPATGTWTWGCAIDWDEIAGTAFANGS
jgi:hypothetical protein